jgi:hypothetical protein
VEISFEVHASHVVHGPYIDKLLCRPYKINGIIKEYEVKTF